MIARAMEFVEKFQTHFAPQGDSQADDFHSYSGYRAADFQGCMELIKEWWQ